jgi:hypothetical protein
MQRAQRTYKSRLKADGLTQVNLIVPVTCVETIKRIAATMRERGESSQDNTNDEII